MLPRMVFYRAVGAIAGQMLQSTINIALSARSIAGAGLHVLTMVLNAQLRGVVSALERWSDEESSVSSTSPEDTTTLPKKFVSGWARSIAVAEILDAPLATIRMRVEAKAFKGALTHIELSRLVHALFSASPARAALVRLLEQQASVDSAGLTPAAEHLVPTSTHSRVPPARPA